MKPPDVTHCVLATSPVWVLTLTWGLPCHAIQTFPVPLLQVFFTKEWANLLETSFRNFLAEVIQKLPLPAILCFNTDRVQRQGLQKKVDQLQVQEVLVGRLA